jgi:hypothetical protein
MRTLLCAVVTAVLSLWQAPAGQPVPSRSLSGRVVTAGPAGEQPVRRARVTLTGTALVTPRVTDTDTRGAYRFDRLPPGSLRIAIQKVGFVKLDADATPDASQTLRRGGAIAGVVADAAGDPIWNVVVTGMQPAPGSAKPRTVVQTRTDDLGRYRLHSLSEGDYYVEAATDAAFAQSIVLRPGEKRPEVTRSFYPASATLEESKQVHVTSGRDTNAVDLTLTPTPPVIDPSALPPPPRPDATGTARIAGRVIDAVSGKPIRNARLLLLPVEGQRITNWQRTNAQGRFEYTSLQARRYTLSAQADGFVTLEYPHHPTDARSLRHQDHTAVPQHHGRGTA